MDLFYPYREIRYCVVARLAVPAGSREMSEVYNCVSGHTHTHTATYFIAIMYFGVGHTEERIL